MHVWVIFSALPGGCHGSGPSLKGSWLDSLLPYQAMTLQAHKGASWKWFQIDLWSRLIMYNRTDQALTDN